MTDPLFSGLSISFIHSFLKIILLIFHFLCWKHSTALLMSTVNDINLHWIKSLNNSTRVKWDLLNFCMQLWNQCILEWYCLFCSIMYFTHTWFIIHYNSYFLVFLYPFFCIRILFFLQYTSFQSPFIKFILLVPDCFSNTLGSLWVTVLWYNSFQTVVLPYFLSIFTILPFMPLMKKLKNCCHNYYIRGQFEISS